MPPRLSRAKSTSKRRSRRSAPDLQILKDVRDTLRDQALRMTPMVRDVQMMHLSRSRVCSFVLFSDYQLIAVSASSNTAFGGYITLANFAGYADYTTCFDQYRILQVVYTFEPLGSFAALALGYTIGVSFDYDDATAPSAVSDLEQFDTFMSVPLGQYFQRILNPRIAYAAYSGAFSSYANQRAGWIDCASSAVQHFGIKWFVPATGTSLNAYAVKAQAFVQFRSQR
jgi:hypothetical protein